MTQRLKGIRHGGTETRRFEWSSSGNLSKAKIDVSRRRGTEARRFKLFSFALLLLLIAHYSLFITSLGAQSNLLPSLYQEAQLRPINVSSFSFWETTDSLARLGFQFHSLQSGFSHSSDIAYNVNNQYQWEGKGMNTWVHTNMGFYSKNFEVQLRPVFYTAENQPFAIDSTGMEGIDLPFRMGGEKIQQVDFGYSRITWDTDYVRLSLSNEPQPALSSPNDPLIGGRQAPGFAHIRLESAKAIPIPSGKIAARMVWGRLEHSGIPDKSDTLQLRNRAISGFTIQYQPDFLPGLRLSFQRWTIDYDMDPLMAFRRNPPVQTPILGVSLRTSPSGASENHWASIHTLAWQWDLNDANAIFYGEWGRQAYRRSFQDLMAEPNFQAAFVLGIAKSFDRGKHYRSYILVETTNLEQFMPGSRYRPYDPWYTSSNVAEGFTHRGQVLGASIGPGSSVQRFQWRAFYRDRFQFGADAARIAHFNDRLYQRRQAEGKLLYTRHFHDIEMRYTLHGGLQINDQLKFLVQYTRSSIENRYNIRFNDLRNFYWNIGISYSL